MIKRTKLLRGPSLNLYNDQLDWLKKQRPRNMGDIIREALDQYIKEKQK